MDLASAIRFFVRQTRTDVKGAGKQTLQEKTVDTHNFALAFLMRNVFVQTCKLASFLVPLAHLICTMLVYLGYLLL